MLTAALNLEIFSSFYLESARDALNLQSSQQPPYGLRCLVTFFREPAGDLRILVLTFFSFCKTLCCLVT
jgi:hypothetical protein